MAAAKLPATGKPRYVEPDGTEHELAELPPELAARLTAPARRKTALAQALTGPQRTLFDTLGGEPAFTFAECRRRWGAGSYDVAACLTELDILAVVVAFQATNPA